MKIGECTIMKRTKRYLLRSYKGMTLIELMATAVIIGIIASMAVPRFSYAFERLRFRKKNRDIVSTVKLARSMAITNKSQYGVYINGNDKQIILFKDIVNPASFTYDSGDSLIKTETLPAIFNYLGSDFTNNTIVFKPNGSANVGGSITTMADVSETVAIGTHSILASTGRIQSQSSYY